MNAIDAAVEVRSVAEQGLKVVKAEFKGVESFNWNVFDGFDRMRVLTYSASAQMIVRMLAEFSFSSFECVFGFEGGLQQVAEIVESQQLLQDKVRDHTLELEDNRKRFIIERIQASRAHFYVVKDNIAHAKIYLLDTDGGEHRRVIVGSANFSERAFGGNQSETLVVFDNDALAWEHYSREYDAIKKTASDRIDMPAALPMPLPTALSMPLPTAPPTPLPGAGTGGHLEEAIPRRAELRIPILEMLKYEALRQFELEARLAAQFNLTDEARSIKHPSGQRKFDKEVWGAKDQLKKRGHIDYPNLGEKTRACPYYCAWTHVSRGKFLVPCPHCRCCALPAQSPATQRQSQPAPHYNGCSPPFDMKSQSASRARNCTVSRDEKEAHLETP